MKSFADWTQELAESVGEVKHHWETSEEPDFRGLNMDMGAAEERDAIIPNWQTPGMPIPPLSPYPISVAYDKCDYCNRENYLFPYTVAANHLVRHICKSCLDTVTP